MPAYKPLDYPDNLTKKHWDKQKGLLAKAAGATGVGEAAQKAETAFKAIDWTKFDIVKLMPLGNGQGPLETTKGLKSGVVAEWNRSVKPTITALKALQKTAGDAGTELGKNKLMKSSATAATKMATDADMFQMSLQLNGVFFSAVSKEYDDAVKAKETAIKLFADIATKTKQFLMALLTGAQKLKQMSAEELDKDKWDALVKQQGRSVSNNLKVNPDLKAKHFDYWIKEFQGFDWDTIGFGNIKDRAACKVAVDRFLVKVIKSGGELAKDL